MDPDDADLDLDVLASERESATVDKSDLFDFYDGYWDDLVAELVTTRQERDELAQDNMDLRTELAETNHILEGLRRSSRP